MKKAKLVKVARTSAGLRTALFDELDALRAGTTTPLKANATAGLARGIIELVRTEMDVARTISHLSLPLSEGNVVDVGHVIRLG